MKTILLFLAATALLAQSGPLGESAMPDPALTPGAVRPGITAADVCVPGYSKKVRNVPLSVKKSVYLSYGMKHWVSGQFELDHLVSLELGGSNGKANLWPESYSIQWNAHVKDRLENRLHAMVCVDHAVDLLTAQRWISTDWIETYKRVFATDQPLP